MESAELLFVVDEVLKIRGRGVVLAPGARGSVRVEDVVEIRRPDGTRFCAPVKGIECVEYPLSPGAQVPAARAVLIPDLGPVPKGSAVWRLPRVELPAALSPVLRKLAEFELSRGNGVVRVEEGVWSACPLAVVFAGPLHFAEAAAAGLVEEGVERWESRDPHYSIEAGYQDAATRHTIAGPIG